MAETNRQRVCQTWAAITGDAGAGGRRCRRVLRNLDQTVGGSRVWIWRGSPTLPNRDSTNPIAYYRNRNVWAATFITTYYTNLRPGSRVPVRVRVGGSEEAKLAAARGTVIDSTLARHSRRTLA